MKKEINWSLAKIKRAAEFAKNKHKKQLDDAGKDYFKTHCYHVFKILKLVTNDEDILCAALLHDTLEDTDTSLEELKKEFGNNIANLVNEVTNEESKNGKLFPRLNSEKAILIKFADRLSNLSRMECWNEKKKKWYLRKSKFWKS